MKNNRFISGFVIFVALFFSACGKQEKLPPVRIGTEGRLRISLEHTYTFEEAYKNAEAVAHIRIGDWIGENDELLLSYYKASVIKLYKGDIPQSIIMLQMGTSKMTAYPLFTAGNEFLVFLQRVTEVESSDPNAFISICSYFTVLDAARSSAGELYFMDRYGRIGATAGLKKNELAILVPELREDLIEKDSLFKEMQYAYQYIFPERDFEILTQKIQGG